MSTVNRFSSYLESQKLAKLLTTQAEEGLRKGNIAHAVRDIVKAQREFMTATNCIASMLFERRRKK